MMILLTILVITVVLCEVLSFYKYELKLDISLVFISSFLILHFFIIKYGMFTAEYLLLFFFSALSCVIFNRKALNNITHKFIVDIMIFVVNYGILLLSSNYSSYTPFLGLNLEIVSTIAFICVFITGSCIAFYFANHNNDNEEKKTSGNFNQFVKNNAFVLIWIISNVGVFALVGAIAKNITVVFVLTIIFQISTIFSLSAIGEQITRFQLRAKPLKTEREKELLLPLFQTVYENVKERYTNVSNDIQVYIENSDNINAFALGRHTICVTKGALQVFNEDELKGVLAHEFGHHVNNDTLMLLLLNCGGGILSLFILCINICNMILNGLINVIFSKDGNNGKLAIFVVKLVKRCLNLTTKPIEWILMAHSRKQEFKADYVAYECGYGLELTDGLYKLKEFSGNEPIGLFERLKNSHPDLADRIEKLENAS